MTLLHYGGYKNYEVRDGQLHVPVTIQYAAIKCMCEEQIV